MSGYQIQIEPGGSRGTWQWEITAPDGTPHCWGATAGKKATVEKKLREYLKRQELPVVVFNGQRKEDALKRRQRARKRNPPPTPANASAFRTEDDQIISAYYADEGWRGCYQRLGGRFTQDQIYRRAYRLGIKCKRSAKRSRWT